MFTELFKISKSEVTYFSEPKTEVEKKRKLINGSRLICCLAIMCTHWLFPLVSFSLRLRRRRNGFLIFPVHFLLSFLMGREQKMSDKWTGEWSEHWAGLEWISTVCLTQPLFHTGRSLPHAPNQMQTQFHCIAGGNNFLFQVIKKKGRALAVLNYPF